MNRNPMSDYELKNPNECDIPVIPRKKLVYYICPKISSHHIIFNYSIFINTSDLINDVHLIV